MMGGKGSVCCLAGECIMTYTQNTKLAKSGILVLDSLDIGRNLAGNVRGREFSEEFAQLLLLFGSVRGIPI